MLPVDAAGLAVHVGLVAEGVEDLNLVASVPWPGGRQEDAAVAPSLPGSVDVGRDPPFQVQLVVLEGAPGLDIAFGLIDRDDAVDHGPGRRGLVLARDPLLEAPAVEQDNRV